MQPETSIESYLRILRTQRQLSSHTLHSYLLDLQELLQFADGKPLHQLNFLDLRRLTTQKHAEGLSPRSIARKLSCWRGFYDWLAQQMALPANPVVGIKAPKRARTLPKALGVDDAVRLVAGDTTNSTHANTVATQASHYANRAMFELLYSSGLRVSELVSLDHQNDQSAAYQSQGWVDFEQGEVHVTGKGNKQRIVPVGQAALAALRDWLAIRPSLLKGDAHPLFLTERGTRMSVRLVQLRIKAHAIKQGIPSDVHPHVLRHSFASHVLQSSGDLRAVQEMLGHSSIAATQVYTSLDFQHLAKVYDATHPRAKK